MKKLPMLLAAALLVIGAGQAASALTHHSAVVVKAALPKDNYNFDAGYRDGTARGIALGKGNPQVQVEVDEARQNSIDAYNDDDVASSDYWWGYRIALQGYL
jgi:hypothetical protein